MAHVLCIPRTQCDRFFKKDEKGFLPLPHYQDANWLYDFTLVDRQFAETCEDWLQLIPYMVFFNFDRTKPSFEHGRRSYPMTVFSYWRQKEAAEQRLAGKRSIGIGGHIDVGDITKGLGHFPSFDLSKQSVQLKDVTDVTGITAFNAGADREAEEEVGVAAAMALQEGYFAGLLYDGTTEVGRVHLGLVFVAEMDFKWMRPQAELAAVDAIDLENVPLDDFEGWSRILLDNKGSLFSGVC